MRANICSVTRQQRYLLVFMVLAVLLFVKADQGGAQEKELRFAITSAVGSDPTFTNYRELSNYIANKLGRKVAFTSGFSYSQVDSLFLKNQVDVGFLCNTHYARKSRDTGFQAIAAPIVTGYNKPKFQVYIIVHKDSSIKSIEDLKGKTVDFSDPLSTTTIYGADMLLLKREKIKSYFGKAIYSGSHDMTVELVANKLVDAGYIDGHIWDYHEKVRPEYSSKTKVIHKSPDFTIPPVVVSGTLEKALKKEIQRILLTMHEDPGGQKILNKLRIDKFVGVKGDEYQDVLQMYNKVKTRL